MAALDLRPYFVLLASIYLLDEESLARLPLEALTHIDSIVRTACRRLQRRQGDRDETCESLSAPVLGEHWRSVSLANTFLSPMNAGQATLMRLE